MAATRGRAVAGAVLTSAAMAASPTELTPAPAGAPDAPSRALLALTVAAFAVRLAFLWLEPRCEPNGDEPTWIAIGTLHMARPNKGLDPFRNGIAFYPPLYAYFFGILFRATRSLTVVLAAQSLVGALLVPAVGRLGSTLFGRRVGLIAAAVIAFYPELVWFSTHFWSETLLLALLWWAIERLVRADRRAATGAALLAGVLWGLAVLTREPPLYLAPIAAVWLAWRRPGGARRAAAFVLALALTVLPWTVRNAIVFRAFVPVSLMGGFNLWLGNSGLSHLQVDEETGRVGGGVAGDRLATRMALRAIRDRQPLWLFEKLASEMPEFWKAGSEVLDQMIGRESCGPLTTRETVRLELLLAGSYLILFALFLLGLARAPAVRGGALVLALLAGYNLMHVVTFAAPRFRLAVLPAIVVFAAAAVGAQRMPLRGRRLALLVLLALYGVLLLRPGLPELALWRWLAGHA